MSISLHPRRGEDLVIGGTWWRYLRELTEALGRDIFDDAGGDEQGGPTPYLPAEMARQYATMIEDHLHELVEVRRRHRGRDEIASYEPTLDSPDLRRRHGRSKLVEIVRIVDDHDAVSFVRQYIELLRNSGGVWIYDERVIS